MRNTMVPIVTFLLDEFAFKSHSQAQNKPLIKLNDYL